MYGREGGGRDVEGRTEIEGGGCGRCAGGEGVCEEGSEVGTREGGEGMRRGETYVGEDGEGEGGC